MDVDQLIKALEKMPKDKIVIITQPDGVGWDNIGIIKEESSVVKIIMDGNSPFQES